MYCAALDTASGKAGFALLRDNDVIVSVNWNVKGREASKLSDYVLAELDKAGVSLQDISAWSVGSGPGSFTGLRQAAALVSGWCFGRGNVKCRCVPGAIALAASALPEEGDEVCCIYDGRNKEILYYNVLFSEGDYHDTGKSGVLNQEQAKNFFSEHQFQKIVCFADEFAAVSKIVPETLEIMQVIDSDASVLCRVKSVVFDNDLTELVYIRPAVYLPEK